MSFREQLNGTGKKNRFAGSYIFYLALLFVLVIIQNPDWDSKILWWGSVVFLLVAFFVGFEGRIIIDNKYSLWILSFIIFSGISFFWAINSALVSETIKSMFVSIIVLFLIRASIKTERDVERVMALVLISIVINTVWLLSTNKAIFNSSIGQNDIADRLGANSLWNSNSIGMMAAIGMFIALYFQSKSKKVLVRYTNFLMVVVMVFVALLSGSRKAALMVGIGICGFLLVTSKGKRLHAILTIALVISVLYYLIMEIPFFYSIIGWRIESLFASFTGKGVVDNSTEYREKYIADALRVWRKYPLFGCGLSCYREINSVVKGMYAHNNYVELLADLGLIGTSIYYVGYGYCLIKLSRIKQKNNLIWLLLITLIVFIVMDFGCVSYNLFLNQVLFMIMFSVVSIYSKKS